MSHPPLDSFGDPARAAADPHVRDCPQCQADLAVQREVRELLASLPDPGPVPPDVVDRIQATLADLARTDRSSSEDLVPATPPGATDQEAVPTAASTVVPITAARSARRRRPLLTVAAAAAVLVGGGYVVSQVVPSGESGSAASGSAIRDRSSSAPKTAELARVPVQASGTNYTTAGLTQQVTRQVGAGRASAAQSQLAGGDESASTLTTPAGLAGCLSALGAPGAVPLLVDVARFEGKPAAVIVLPSDDGGREVWVVAPTCRPGEDGMTYFRTIR